MKDWKCIHCGHPLSVEDVAFASGRQDLELCPGWALGKHQDAIVHRGKTRPSVPIRVVLRRSAPWIALTAAASAAYYFS